MVGWPRTNTAIHDADGVWWFVVFYLLYQVGPAIACSDVVSPLCKGRMETHHKTPINHTFNAGITSNYNR